MTDPSQKLQSDVIAFLRFPLIVGVVFIHIHGYMMGPQMTHNLAYYYCAQLFSEDIFRTIVPIFFVISGFLFFNRIDKFNNAVYCNKLRSRAKSLLIPYLIWLSAYVAFYYISYYFFGSDSYQEDIQENLLFRMMYGNEWRKPLAIQFWFIRDLIIAIILSPLYYVLCKYLKWVGLIVLGLFWFLNGELDSFFNITGLSHVCAFFFATGAYIAINRKNLIEWMARLRYTGMAWPLIAVADLLSKQYDWNLYVHHAGILCGIIFWINMVAKGISAGRLKVNRFLEASSFFVFAIHMPPLLSVVHKTLTIILRPQTDAMFVLQYFAEGTLIVLIALAIYAILRKISPTLTNILTGNRAGTSKTGAPAQQ